MNRNHNRITFIVTDETKLLIDKAKKEYFYDQNSSVMIRKLLNAGLKSESEKKKKNIKQLLD